MYFSSKKHIVASLSPALYYVLKPKIEDSDEKEDEKGLS